MPGAGADYTVLGVSPEAFITSNEDDTTHLPERSKITIPPGQFGLLITLKTIYSSAWTVGD
jgi:hypothetical protein